MTTNNINTGLGNGLWHLATFPHEEEEDPTTPPTPTRLGMKKYTFAEDDCGVKCRHDEDMGWVPLEPHCLHCGMVMDIGDGREECECGDFVCGKFWVEHMGEWYDCVEVYDDEDTAIGEIRTQAELDAHHLHPKTAEEFADNFSAPTTAPPLRRSLRLRALRDNSDPHIDELNDAIDASGNCFN